MGKIVNFFNCLTFRHGEIVSEDLWVRNGKIIDPSCADWKADVYVDCRGTLISPGFIDLKCNGGFGVSFSDIGPVETPALENGQYVRAQVDIVCKQLPSTGVTLFCPTILSSSPGHYRRILSAVRKKPASPYSGAGILGIHLDGPFIRLPGGHNTSFIRGSLAGGMQCLSDALGPDLESVAIMALAPELPGASEVIPELVRRGIHVSLAHSEATFLEAEKAFSLGASFVSHLFNTMPQFHHRDPGVVGLVASRTEGLLPESTRGVDDKANGRERSRVRSHDGCVVSCGLGGVNRIYVTMISDGYHVHPAALRMAYRMAGDSLIIISDSQAPLGMAPGEYVVGGVDVIVSRESLPNLSPNPFHAGILPLQTQNESEFDESSCPTADTVESADLVGPHFKCTLSDTKRLFGAVCPMNSSLRLFQGCTNCSTEYVLAAVTERPAKAFGLFPTKGSLSVGSDADLVILDKLTFKVHATLIAGVPVFSDGSIEDIDFLADGTRHTKKLSNVSDTGEKFF